MTDPIDRDPPNSSPSLEPDAPPDESVTESVDIDAPANDVASPLCTDGQPIFFRDSWGRDCSPGETFMSEMAGNDPPATASPATDAKAVSLHQLKAQSAAGATAANVYDTPMAHKLEDMLGHEGINFDAFEYANSPGQAFGPVHRAITGLSAPERTSLAKLVAQPDKARGFFRRAMQGRSDVEATMFSGRGDHLDAAAEAMVDEIQTQITAGFKQRVVDRVGAITRKASQPYRAINASSQSRRAFLGQLAQLEDDPAKLSERLTDFGLDDDAASSIANQVATARRQPDGIAALRAGQNGPARPGIQVFESDNSYEFAEQTLQDELTDKVATLKNLRRRASSGQITGSLLTDDNFKSVRDDIFADMNPRDRDSVEQIVGEATSQVEGDQAVDDAAKLVVELGAAIGVTAMTAGLTGPAALAAGTATTAAGSAPDVMMAWEDVDLAEMAAQKQWITPDGTPISIDMTDQNAADKAKRNRNVTTAAAAASLLMGAAPRAAQIKNGAKSVGEVGNLAADALKEGATTAAMHAATEAAKK